MKIICSNIKWDTDGVSAKKLGLPDTVTITEDDITDEMIDDINEDYNDSITDYLSDTYGFCIYSLSVETENERLP